MSSLRSLVLSAVSTTALIAIGSVAVAADLLPTHKAPPAPVAAAPNWAGAYVGVEGGVGWGHTDWRTTALGGGVVDSTGSQKFSQTGGRAGVYAGYNWMVAPTALVGLEADVAGDFFEKKSVSGIPGTRLNLTPPGAPFADTASADSPSYDASVRARFGVLVTPSTLLFATGGVAFADPKYAISCPSTGNSWCFNPESGSSNPTRVGGTVGVGFETFLASNWLLRAEYRYSGFPGKTTTFFPNGGFLGSDSITVRTTYDMNTVNVGLAYKF
jgi:outer membrane immunogenic protein